MEFKPGDRVLVRSYEGCPSDVATVKCLDHIRGLIGVWFNGWTDGHNLANRYSGGHCWWVDPTHISKYYELPEPTFTLEELTELQL